MMWISGITRLSIDCLRTDRHCPRCLERPATRFVPHHSAGRCRPGGAYALGVAALLQLALEAQAARAAADRDIVTQAPAAPADCNTNGISDDLDISAGTSLDCNLNTVPDECDIALGGRPDFNRNGVPDECDPDCNGNGYPDFIDLAFELSLDCHDDGVPDECQLVANDCDTNAIPDDCEGRAAGDADHDGDVDLPDFVLHSACLIGPECDRLPCAVPVYLPGCCPSDLDGDGDVDLLDHARFQRLLP